MKTLKNYSKTGLRFAILSILGMALTIVAKPQNAMAITPCLQACITALQQCDLACGSPPRITQPCTSACGARLASCEAQCH
jgi:hypothetical protein